MIMTLSQYSINKTSFIRVIAELFIEFNHIILFYFCLHVCLFLTKKSKKAAVN